MQATTVTSSSSEDSTEEVSMASDSGSLAGSIGVVTHRQYNTAMAKRMRQRRMRRMKERDTTPFTFAERDEAGQGHNESYKQKKSNLAAAAAAGVDEPISSVPKLPPSPPKILKKQIPNRMFALSDQTQIGRAHV